MRGEGRVADVLCWGDKGERWRKGDKEEEGEVRLGKDGEG